MSAGNAQKPAFPPNANWEANDFHARGLTKREYIAALALQGLLAADPGDKYGGNPSVPAEDAVLAADALLAALSPKEES